ncbi:MAG: GTPase RsgA [Rivihabitans pingtungensis]
MKTSARCARACKARSVLVGQSGMGKSTITNALPDACAQVGGFHALDSGRHTCPLALPRPDAVQPF